MSSTNAVREIPQSAEVDDETLVTMYEARVVADDPDPDTLAAMQADVRFCRDGEGVVSPGRTCLTAFYSGMELDASSDRSVPLGYIDLDSEGKPIMSTPLAMFRNESVPDRVSAADDDLAPLDEETVFATASKAPPKGAKVVENIKLASMLDCELTKVEERVTTCAGCRRGLLLRHIVALLEYLLERIMTLPDRTAARLFDRLAAVDAQLA